MGMELANGRSKKLGSNVLTLRCADEADEADIFRLLNNASYAHTSADFSISADLWEQRGVFVAERQNTLKAALATSCEPQPVAWIRSVAVDMSDPGYAMRKLLPMAVDAMRKQGAHCLACMSINRWLDIELERNGFSLAADLESLERPHEPLPSDASISVLVRDVTSADLAQLFALDQRAFPNPIWWQSERQLARALKAAASFTLAEVDGVIAGYQMGVQSGSRAAHMVRMSVDPACQGRGVGGSLMTHAIRRYQRRNLHKISLNTQLDNDASHRLYKRFGFQSAGQQFRVWSHAL